ncbi:hypothetical protein CKY04_05595 [Photorhabdus sp. S8-52]|nr:hypothetical protein CKY03_07525 [Photorhabdus sp. S9-53]RAX01002.1 hypothetical protein CKY05_07385 [Photorhabdus sp. S10-54]RAX05341.1 hypothetical protein CKY04_05595 [Photorhabdus sp. S8-52]
MLIISVSLIPSSSDFSKRGDQASINIPVIFQAASLLAALTHPGHIVCYAPGDSLLCRRDTS